MSAKDLSVGSATRRKLLGSMASAGALLGMSGASLPAARAAEPGAAPEELLAMARLRSYKARRSSSWDRTGGNDDAVPVEAGASATVLDVQGAGVVTHLWFTINSQIGIT